MGKEATSPLPPRGSPSLQSGGQNQKWPTSGPGGYITPAAWGVPTASERGGRIRSGPQMGKEATSPLPPPGSPPVQSGGAESEVAQKWARWLHNIFRLGGSPLLQSGGQNQMWPTSGQGGYITLAAWGVPTASDRGAELEVAQKWARWLHNPCRLGGRHRFRAGGRIRSGPQVGKVAT